MLEKLEGYQVVTDLNSKTSNQNWWSGKSSGGKRRLTCRYGNKVYPDMSIWCDDTLDAVRRGIEVMKNIIQEIGDEEWKMRKKDAQTLRRKSLIKTINLKHIAICSLFFMAGQAQANVEPNSDGWRCASVSDWQIAQVVVDKELIFNNFVLRERSSFMSGSLRVLEVSFSVTNRSAHAISLNTQIVGFSDSGDLKFAVSADPTFDLITEQRTETITGDTYVYPNQSVLSETASVCFNVVADM